MTSYLEVFQAIYNSCEVIIDDITITCAAAGVTSQDVKDWFNAKLNDDEIDLDVLANVTPDSPFWGQLSERQFSSSDVRSITSPIFFSSGAAQDFLDTVGKEAESMPLEGSLLPDNDQPFKPGIYDPMTPTFPGGELADWISLGKVWDNLDLFSPDSAVRLLLGDSQVQTDLDLQLPQSQEEEDFYLHLEDYRHALGQGEIITRPRERQRGGIGQGILDGLEHLARLLLKLLDWINVILNLLALMSSLEREADDSDDDCTREKVELRIGGRTVAGVVFGSVLGDRINGRLIKPGDLKVMDKVDVVEFAYQALCEGSPFPPIPLIKGVDFDVLRDGHHRFIASRLVDIPVDTYYIEWENAPVLDFDDPDFDVREDTISIEDFDEYGNYLGFEWSDLTW